MKLPSDLGYFRECCACGVEIPHLPEGSVEVRGHVLALCGNSKRKGCKDRPYEQALALTLGRLERGEYLIAAEVGNRCDP